MNATFAYSKNTNTDFEAWARLLICRKVPDDYRRLIDSQVVHEGADILKRGDAFEVRIRESGDGSGQEEILVTPFPIELSEHREAVKIAFHTTARA